MITKVLKKTDTELVLHLRAEDGAEQTTEVAENPFGTGKVLLVFEPAGGLPAYDAAAWRVDGATDAGEKIVVRKNAGDATAGAEAVVTITPLVGMPLFPLDAGPSVAKAPKAKKKKAQS